MKITGETGVAEVTEWTEWKECPANRQICGLRTRVHYVSEGSAEDKTGLNGVEFFCCIIKPG